MLELEKLFEKIEPSRLKVLFIRLIRLIVYPELEKFEIIRCAYCKKIICEKDKVGQCKIQCRHCKSWNVFNEDDHYILDRDKN